jgi:hypothetical protein
MKFAAHFGSIEQHVSSIAREKMTQSAEQKPKMFEQNKNATKHRNEKTKRNKADILRKRHKMASDVQNCRENEKDKARSVRPAPPYLFAA